MAGPFLARDYEFAVNKESTYGTSPGNPVAGDFFKHTSMAQVDRQISRFDRDRDRDGGQASVLSTHKGREKSAVSIEADLIPSGNASTPTEPDTDVLWEILFGTKHKATAHTTTAAGSTGTTLNLTPGGGAASGIQAGDLIAVDVDATNGYEVRRVVSITTDTVTIDLAFTANPAAARTVKVGTTYRLSSAAKLSAHLWRFNGDDLRYKVPGVVISEGGIEINFGEDTPVATQRWSGEGQPQATQSVSRPTPATAGLPLVPSEGKVWLGATLFRIVMGSFTVNNGLELRNNQSDALYPTGVKRTGNNSRFNVSAALDLLAYTTTPDAKALYDNSPALTQRATIVQLGSTPGTIVAWCMPNWRPDAEEKEIDGEVGYGLSGRAYGSTADDEIFLGFI